MEYVPNQCKTQQMCERALDVCSYALEYVTDQIQEMCKRATQKDLCALESVSDWFVTPKMLKELANDEGLDKEEVDEVITCCNDYKQHKAQKVQVNKG